MGAAQPRNSTPTTPTALRATARSARQRRSAADTGASEPGGRGSRASGPRPSRRARFRLPTLRGCSSGARALLRVRRVRRPPARRPRDRRRDRARAAARARARPPRAGAPTRRGAAGTNCAAAGLGVEPALLDDDPPAGDHRDRPARELAALVRGVADAVVEHGGRDADPALGIPEGEIRVAADRDRSLAGVEAVELRVVGRPEGDELVQREPARRRPPPRRAAAAGARSRARRWPCP